MAVIDAESKNDLKKICQRNENVKETGIQILPKRLYLALSQTTVTVVHNNGGLLILIG